MEYQLIVFDVEGTLVETKSGDTFRRSEDDWQLIPGRRQALKALNAHLALASNQGGAAFGLLDQALMQQELERLAREVDARLYVCYHHPAGSIDALRQDCECRKPRPGMILQAMADTQVIPGETLVVGDRAEDRAAAVNARAHFMWAKDFFAPYLEGQSLLEKEEWP